VSEREEQEPTTQAEATPTEATPAEQTPARPARPVPAEASSDRTRRKVRTGVVVSEKMDKTVLVRIDRKVRHPLYKKTLARSNKLAAHDENNDARLGDTVRVMETRPISKTKRWRIVEIVERAK
jgi:small subunit ribosomal protein S17